MASLPLPQELKEFYDVFSRLSYGLNDTEVFDDFLLWIMAGFSFDIKWESGKKYNEKQIRMFWELFQHLIKGTEQILKEREWCDPFGTFYENAISSHSRRAGAGQFFTPEHIVDLMVDIQGETARASKEVRELKGAGIRVCDPTCGSGRMLISFHAHFPGNYEFGEDIDRTCCLMTVCNMLLSGAVGEVVWHNSLAPDSWFGGWRVNETLRWTGIPFVREIQKKESFSYQHWQQRKVEKNTPKKAVNVKSDNIPETVIPESTGEQIGSSLPSGTQLSLFFE